MKRHLLVIITLIGVGLGAPASAWAQGFAPAKGTLWTKFGIVTTVATDTYAGLDEIRIDPSIEAGSRVPFYSTGGGTGNGERVGGNLQIHELMSDIIYAPWERVSVTASLPLLKYVRYHNDSKDYTSTAIRPGDVWLSLGYQFTPDSLKALGSTLRVRGKIPTSFELPYGDRALLGDGQFDVGVESANTVKLGPLSIDASVTYMHRRPASDDTTEIRLGDELRISTAVGGSPAKGLWMSAGYASTIAETWEIERETMNHITVNFGSGLSAATAEGALIEPKIHTAFASIYYSFGPKDGVDNAIDFWFKVPLAGQDMPVLWSAGVGYVWAMTVD